MDVVTEAYVTLQHTFGMNMTLRNWLKNITRCSVFYCLFFFKYWLVVALKIRCSGFLQLKFIFAH